MTKKRKGNSKNSNSRTSLLELTSKDTLSAILGVLSTVLAILFLLAAFNVGGQVGRISYRFFSYLFGIGYYLIPAVFLVLSISLFRSEKRGFAMRQMLGSLLLFISTLGLIDLLFRTESGLVGHYISSPLISLFDIYASAILLIALTIISILIIFDTSIRLDILTFLGRIFRRKVEAQGGLAEGEEAMVNKATEEIGEKIKQETRNNKQGMDKEKGSRNDDDGFMPMLLRKSGKQWVPPPLSLLGRDRGKPGVGDIKANANIIKRTLQNFGIVVEMDEISIGPSVTRYALKPSEGVKLSKILSLQNNLELALAAHPVRIEAPIPGKSLVGIEVPNTLKSTIGLGSLISEGDYVNSPLPLLVALGRDISGHSRFANLGKMPHLLIAGATGSGKSVTIHAIVNSLLFRNPPENLKFIMIDPKRVELTPYNGIPHLLTPVITDPKKSILALKWTAKEMERRYDILEKTHARDIDSYHKNIYLPELEKQSKKGSKNDTEGPIPMPYILIVIDELADLMQSYPRELESAIVRLAQMSRAVGIHLILSTQRPSVNIITGLIKANIPARIALQVASQIDSRTILDSAGAEKLLGAGDMLYLSAEMSKPSRIQSAYIAEAEVKNVANYLREVYADELEDQISLTHENTSNAIFSASLGENDLGDEDELYEEARETVISAGKASTSFLQRKLRVGYARAARLVDMLEERGVIGPGDGAKAREVLSEAGQNISESNLLEDIDVNIGETTTMNEDNE
ncbi:MAG: DNA translocase FtsK 4TM domain-containing protein [bacterium]